MLRSMCEEGLLSRGGLQARWNRRAEFPISLEGYRVGQLYTISKHSHQESDKGEGVEVVKNEPHEDPVHGPGQFTEKRVHLSSWPVSPDIVEIPSPFESPRRRADSPVVCHSSCPVIIILSLLTTSQEGGLSPASEHSPQQASQLGAGCDAADILHHRKGLELLPVYYHSNILSFSPQCSFLPKFSIYIETKYEDNCGDNANIFHSDKILGDHEVTFLDIAFDEIPERYYRSPEDLRYFSSTKTGRGPLREGWREHTQPIMCSYKLVTVKFEVWGLQTRVEQFVHKVIRDILLIGHRQAFAWVDEWCGPKALMPFPASLLTLAEVAVIHHAQEMTMDEVRQYERETQEATNEIVGTVLPTVSISDVCLPANAQGTPSSAPSTPLSGDAPDFLSVPKDRPRKKSAPEMLTLPVLRERANAE
ncbi:UNVERIFIED_CONTAM: hypothetical protein K2H54_010220 [Gekko kuhli]